ncbi:hypothetical protein FQR65_LT17270 [Abscondita terminalis]|nr:hypothetical protein FQR65_LT17270 [Abscondita terminalis]
MSCSSNVNFNWTRELTTELIMLYEQHSCLYAVASKDYSNKNKRQQALESICKALMESNTIHLQVEQVKKKIHGIRAQFLTEKNKIRKSSVSGTSTDELYVPKLWCYEILQFLDDNASTITNKGTSNLQCSGQTSKQGDKINNITEVEFEGTIDEDGNFDVTSQWNMNLENVTSPISNTVSDNVSVTSDIDTSVPIKRRRKNSKGNSGIEAEVSELMSMATKTLQNCTPNETEFSVFGQLVAIEIAKIKNDQLLDELKLDIMNRISLLSLTDEASMGNVSELELSGVDVEMRSSFVVSSQLPEAPSLTSKEEMNITMPSITRCITPTIGN